MFDTISINDLQVHLANGLGPSAFGLPNPPPCPISLTLNIHLKDGNVSADEDSMIGLGVNYSSVSKQIYALLSDPKRTFSTPSEVLHAAAAVPLGLDAVEAVGVSLELPRALLHAQSVVYSAVLSSSGEGEEEMMMKIKGLGVVCVIGLHPHERAERQRLEVDLEFKGWAEGEGHRSIANTALTVSLIASGAT
jgi:dihydroneopterin aldolase/2-amino-4-hydroxy-6-hydroxymethyldihydropteridine diphosphokinase/dihydropteroate synthase